MSHGLKILLASACVLVGTASLASAETFRMPKSGNPAVVAEAPRGWTGQNTGANELTISSPDNMALLEVQVISDPAMVAKSLPDIAHQVFINADLSPRWSETQPETVAGLQGQAFIEDIARDGVPVGLCRIVIAKIDAGHAVRLTEITLPKDTPPDQVTELKNMVAHLTISGR